MEVAAPPYGGLLVREESVVFGVPHWATPREVQLYARDDGTLLPDGPVVLTHRVLVGDYDGVSAGSVAVTIVERVSPTFSVKIELADREPAGDGQHERAVNLTVAARW